MVYCEGGQVHDEVLFGYSLVNHEFFIWNQTSARFSFLDLVNRVWDRTLLGVSFFVGESEVGTSWLEPERY